MEGLVEDREDFLAGFQGGRIGRVDPPEVVQEKPVAGSGILDVEAHIGYLASVRPAIVMAGAGAKQNRVLNTTILVDAGAELVIPVGCTEQGRWGYVSEEFSASGHLMSRNLRVMNRRAVAASLVSITEYCIDQGALWGGINNLAAGSNRTSGSRHFTEPPKMR